MMHSPLARLPVPRRAPDPDEGRRLAREAFHNHGIVMLRTDWLTSVLDRELLMALAETVHGKKAEW